VAFNDKAASVTADGGGAASWRIEATMTLKSEFPDPSTVPYKDALYGAEYRVEKVLEGEGIGVGDTIVVAHWAFENKKLKPSAGYEVGSRRTLELAPFETRAELQTMQLANDADPTILELYWGEAGTEEKDVAGISNRPARLIAGGACGAASLLVVIVIAWVARREGKR